MITQESAERLKAKATTIKEILALVIVFGTLALLYFPAALKARSGPRRISCLQNLQGIGFGFRLFASDHDGRFPMSVSTSNKGVLELIQDEDPSIIVRTLSNYVGTPKIFRCDKDTRKAAESFNRFNSQNMSYFIGIDAEESSSQSILAGDRNFLVNGLAPSQGIRLVKTNDFVDWSDAMHSGTGFIVLSDGSVQQLSGQALRRHLKVLGAAANRFSFP